MKKIRSATTVIGLIGDGELAAELDAELTGTLAALHEHCGGRKKAKAKGRVTLTIDLTEFGWSQAQAMRWGTAAHEAARSAAVVTQDAVERLAARESAHVASLAPFDVDRIAAAGEAAVAAALGEAPDDFGGAAA